MLVVMILKIDYLLVMVEWDKYLHELLNFESLTNRTALPSFTKYPPVGNPDTMLGQSDLTKA